MFGCCGSFCFLNHLMTIDHDWRTDRVVGKLMTLAEDDSGWIAIMFQKERNDTSSFKCIGRRY